MKPESPAPNPRVTVLMSVFNAPVDFLAEAVDSILAQEFNDFELLILDDGSTAAEPGEFLRRKAAEDRRIRIQWEPNRGLTPTLNRGLELARGELIARHDADDWSAPQRLAKQVAVFEHAPELTLLGSAIWTHQERGQKLWPVTFPATHEEIRSTFPRGNPFVHGATMFRRSAAEAVGGYEEAFRCAQDYDFFWRLSERGKSANLAEPLYHYRYTSGSISSQKATAQMEAHLAIKKLAAARSQGILKEAAQALAEVSASMAGDGGLYRSLLKQADHLMLAGDYFAAWRSYMKLLGAHPASPLAWAKLARLGVFRTAPFLREACFR